MSAIYMHTNEIIKPIILKSTTFLRLFTVFLAIILAFNTVCKPKEADAAVTGTVITLGTVAQIVGIVGGIVGTVGGIVALYDRYKAAHPDENLPNSLEEWGKNNITVDGSGNYILTDNAKLVIQGMVEEYQSQATFMYMYLPGTNTISPTAFDTKIAYEMFVELVQSNPDCVFVLHKLDNRNMGYDTEGNSIQLGGRVVEVYKLPSYGVNKAIGDNHDFSTAFTDVNMPSPTTFYSESWGQIERATLILHDSVSNPNDIYIYYDTPDKKGHYIYSSEYEGKLDGYINNLAFSYYGNPSFRAFYSYNNMPWESLTSLQDYGITYFNGAIPVFRSVEDMKVGTGKGTEYQYIPGYSGNTHYGDTITQTMIEEYNETYNYYYGSDSNGGGSGSGSGGSSSGSGFLDTFLNALGGLGDTILGILAKLLEFVTNGIELIANTFSKLTGLFQNGFVDFLTAVFPFMPSEWVTAITVALCLGVLAVIWSLFRK